MINYIFDKLLVKIQLSHEKLVRCEARKKKNIMMSRKNNLKNEIM